jgi:hypothetical protein
LDDIGRSLPWRALGSFIENITPDSALAYELDPKMSAWATARQTNILLADIFDMLAIINANLMAFGGKKPKKPAKYPRPWREDQNKETRHFGKDPLPIAELDKWFERKRLCRSQSKSQKRM